MSRLLTPLPVVVFTDLDDSLFSSGVKQSQLMGQPESLQAAALLANGDVISYSNPAQRALLSMLSQAAAVIPVTARNVDGFGRVQLRFSSWAIVSHGATLLTPQGEVDQPWREQVRALLAAGMPALHVLHDALNAPGSAALAQGCRVRMVQDDGESIYLVVKHPGGDAVAVRAFCSAVIQPWLAQHPGYTLHINGNNLALLPPGIGKAPALAYLRPLLEAQLGPFMALGVGDSLTDAAFMLACDYALLPTRSQIAAHLSASLEP